MDTTVKGVADAVLERIAGVVGPKGVITDAADMAPYLIDQRKDYQGRAPMVVRPASTDEVSKVLAICNQTGTLVVPQGGNTGLVGAATPDGTGDQILISLTRMNKVRAVDAGRTTIGVRPW